MKRISERRKQMNLESDLPARARSLGADYYGVADLGSARDFIIAQGGDRVAGYPRAVVLGIRLLDTVVDLVADRKDRIGAALYRHNSYDVVNAALDGMALQVANSLQQQGYRALPVPASKRASDEKIAGIFSQKLAAHLAGLGWIGKSCLLVTPDHGPRVRWIAVLTDAPLVPTGPPMKSRCGECTACVDICPVHAFTGRPFREDEPREARYNAAACDRYFRELEAGSGPVVCGLCLFVCPYGRMKGKVAAHKSSGTE
jgi:epoxyqueuosine reductase